jgi:glycosyltransferase involved in cell wall biosynthesis
MSQSKSPPIALFALNFPAGTGYAWATIERVLIEVKDRLEKAGWQVRACRPAGGRGSDPLVEAGIPVEKFDFSGAMRGGRKAREFCELLRRRKVRLLYLTDQPSWSLRYLLFRLVGVRKIVVHDRTSGTRSRRPAPVRLLKRLIHRLPGIAADRWIGISKFVVHRLIEVNGVPPGRVVLVYNGIDLARFEGTSPGALQHALGLPAGTMVVFASGRAMPYKGIPVLIQAAALMAQTDPEVHFAYAGDGPAREEFEREVRSLGLNRFHFLGKRTDTAELLCSATVAVAPSVWAEAFGLTVVEAMAAGVPVVASAVGGIPELVDPDVTGILVPPGDAAALADALRRLIQDPALREQMGGKARAAAVARFSHTRVANELAAVLLG